MNTYNPRQPVELFHLLFLAHLGRELDKKLYALKGGCNMRFYFNSIRYSEDMDIDVQTIAKDTLQKKVQKILISRSLKNLAQAKGIDITTISAPKQTDTTQRWKISLKTPHTQILLPTKIEFSRRGLNEEFAFENVNPLLLREYSLPPIMANHYSYASMYNQKVMALALRNQTQARDIFDLYFLINSGMSSSLKMATSSQNIALARANALTVSFAEFKSKVVAYLLEEYRIQYDSKVIWDNIVNTVVASLDKE